MTSSVAFAAILAAASGLVGCDPPRARSYQPAVKFTGLVDATHRTGKNFHVSLTVPAGYLRPFEDTGFVHFSATPEEGAPRFLLTRDEAPKPDDSPTVAARFRSRLEHPCGSRKSIVRRTLDDGVIDACVIDDITAFDALNYRVVRVLRIGEEILRCEAEAPASVPEVTRQEMIDVCMSLRATICIDEVTYPGDDCDKHIDTKLLVAPRSW